MKNIAIKVRTLCGFCAGRAFVPTETYDTEPCPACDGRGMVTQSVASLPTYLSRSADLVQLKARLRAAADKADTDAGVHHRAGRLDDAAFALGESAGLRSAAEALAGLLTHTVPAVRGERKRRYTVAASTASAF